MPRTSPERPPQEAWSRSGTAASNDTYRKRRNDKRLDGLAEDAPLTEAQLARMREDYLTQLLSVAPPMTAEQLAICRQLLPPVPVGPDGQPVPRPEPKPARRARLSATVPGPSQ